jgi:iron complex outermembrane receptor protein
MKSYNATTVAPGHPHLTAIAAAVAMLGLGASSLALSQEAAPQADPGEALQSVIVTAQKRAEPMQKTPVAINTVDAKAIENQRIVAFDDLTRVAPSMTVTQNSTNSSVSLRGVGTQSVSIGVESAVSIIVDDVPVVQQLQAFANLSDVERIEVLRGPQGTLFGKNAAAGVINIVTKESSDYLSGSVQATLTSAREKRLETSLSGPLGERAGFRLNAYRARRDGYIDNLTNGARVNGENSRGLRARLDWQPLADLKLRFIADYAERDGLGPNPVYLSVPAGARLFGQVDLSTRLDGLMPGVDNFAIRQDKDGDFKSTQGTFSVAANWKLGGHTLTSITSYQDWKFDYTMDLDASDVDLLGAITRGAVHGGLVAGGPFQSTMLTQELRVASNGGGPLNYLAGLYYANADSDRAYHRGPVAFLANWTAQAKNKTSAMFGQLDYKFRDDTRLVAGLRANHQTIGVEFNDLQLAVPARYVGNTSENAVTGKLSLQRDLAKDVMVFGSFSTGYKGSGYDISSGFNQSRADNPAAPEKSRSHELGIKSRFLNNRLQLNATAFLTDYNDFQAQSSVIDSSTGLLALRLNNVGKLRTRGVELEGAYKPNRAWLFEASAAYTDATIRTFPNANCYPGQTVGQGCVTSGSARVQDLAGKKLPNAPRLKGTLGTTYDFAVGDGDLRGILNLNYQYQSKVNFDLFQNPLTVQGGYGVVNGSFALGDSNRGYKVTFFANNLFDKSYTGNINDNAGVFGGVHVLTATLPRNAQRYVGMRVKYEF